MEFYSVPNMEINKSIKTYKKMGEKMYVSELVKCNSNMYREVVFSKKMFNFLKEEVTGYLYINQYGEIVTQKQVIEKLNKVFFFYSSFFYSQGKKSFVNALQSEGAAKGDEHVYDECKVGLDVLKKDGYKESEIISRVFDNVLKLRKASNEILDEIIEEAEKKQKENGSLDEKFIEDVQVKYREILRLNFDKVKTINSARNFYDELKKKAHKKKRSLTSRFNSNVTMPLARLDYVIAYYKRIILSYDKVLDMTTSQYMKYLNTVEKHNLQHRMELLRNKK